MTRIALTVMRLGVLAMACTSAAISAAWAEDSLYAGLGGRPGIERFVDIAVSKFLADDRVKDDFDNISLGRLKARLTDEICVAIDGPCQYKGRPMAAAHAGLEISRAKFNAVAEDLQSAMEQSGVAYWTQNRVMARLAPMQRDIVNR